MSYQYLILATDWATGQPGGGSDTGKGSQAGGGDPKDPWNAGFRTLKGEWEPEGLRVMAFDTEDEAKKWWDANKGASFGNKYDNIIMVRIHAW